MRAFWIIVCGAVLIVVTCSAGAALRWSGERNISMGPCGPGDPSLGQWSLDFNGDGEMDIMFSFFTEEFLVSPQGSNATVVTPGDAVLESIPLLPGSPVVADLPSPLSWAPGVQPLVHWFGAFAGEPFCDGPWCGTSNRYLGVSFQIHGQTHYGWVEISISGEAPYGIIHSWAYETVPERGLPVGLPIHYVSPAGHHISPYTSWTDAATNIQAAIDVAQYGEVVLVTDATYSVTAAITLTNGVTVASVNGRGTVIINGQGRTRVVSMDHPDAVLQGITAANGRAEAYQSGGGIHCNSGRVQDCAIQDSNAYNAGGIFCGTGGVIVGTLVVSNNATGLDWNPGSGGGILCNGGRIEDCVVRDNRAYGDGSLGGGIACGFSASVVSTIVTGNRAAYAAGVACVVSSRVDRCTITGNVGTGAAIGGGLWAMGGDVTSSLIVGNTAITGAGAVLGPLEPFGFGDPGMLAATSRLINCTVAANIAQNTAGGVMCSSNAVIQNSIIWTNAAPIFANVATGTPETVFLYTCTTPLAPGTGNITNAPQLTPSYRLKSTSPCIDAGTDSIAPPTDIDGETRWDHPGHSNVVSIVDIGADEFVDTDLDLMADCWETAAFGSVTNRDGTADADSDDLNDLSEYNNSTTPTNADTDADEMPDGWEMSHSLDPLAYDAQGDPDFDTMRNLGEYISDTDPRDANSVLSIIRIDRQLGGIRLDWKGGRQAWQILEYRGELASTNEQWTAIFALPPPTALTNAVIDMGATNPALFYRIRAER